MILNLCLVLVSKSAASVTGLIFSLIIARVYSLETAGELFLILTIVQFFSKILCLGLTNFVTREGAVASNIDSDINKFTSILSNCFFSITLVFVVLLLPCMFLYHYITENSILESVLVLLCIYIGAICELVIPSYQAIKKANRGVIVRLVVQNGFMSFVVILFSPNSFQFTLFYFLSHIFVFFIYYFDFCIKRNIGIFKVNFSFINDVIIQQVKTLLPNALLSVSLNQLPLLFVGAMFNSNVFAIFTIANRVAYLIGFFLSAIRLVIASDFALLYKQKRYTEIKMIMEKVTSILGVICICLFLIFLLFGNEILTMFGEEYVQSKTILLILTLGQLVNGLFGPVGLLLLMASKNYLVVKSQVITFSFMVMLFLLAWLADLSPLYVAGVIMLSFFLQNTLYYIYIRKFTHINFNLFSYVSFGTR